MRVSKPKNNAGFSLIELMISMVIVILLLGLVSTLLSRSLSVRARESRKTDALTSAQAALNIMSREIANSGFGIYDDPSPRPQSTVLSSAAIPMQISFTFELT